MISIDFWITPHDFSLHLWHQYKGILWYLTKLTWQFYFWSLYQFLDDIFEICKSSAINRLISLPVTSHRHIQVDMNKQRKCSILSSVTSVPQTHLSVRVEPDTRRESKNNDNVEKIHSEITCNENESYKIFYEMNKVLSWECELGLVAGHWLCFWYSFMFIFIFLCFREDVSEFSF